MTLFQPRYLTATGALQAGTYNVFHEYFYPPGVLDKKAEEDTKILTHWIEKNRGDCSKVPFKSFFF